MMRLGWKKNMPEMGCINDSFGKVKNISTRNIFDLSMQIVLPDATGC